MKPLGINFGTSAQVLGYAGKAGWITPLWATDTYKLYICDGNTGTKHEVALKTDLSAYATTAAMNSALGGKANSSHTHTKANITNFAHSHAQSDVTGLNTALNAKLNTSDLETALSELITEFGGTVPAD